MSAKPTPGPWEAELLEKGAFEVFVDPAIDMGWYRVISSRGPCSHRASESHANARLIAAAPDLLDALKNLEAMAERYRPPGNSVPDAQKAARAAIAKAEGQS